MGACDKEEETSGADRILTKNISVKFNNFLFKATVSLFYIFQIKKYSSMQETWVRSLGWEDSLEKAKATHSSILAWRIPWTIHGVTKSRTRLSDFHFL